MSQRDFFWNYQYLTKVIFIESKRVIKDRCKTQLIIQI